MKMLEELTKLNEPYFHLAIVEKLKVERLFSINEMVNDIRVVMRKIEGNNCTSTDGLFEEFSKVFQFPNYFGSNWDALDECLNDLEWLEGDAYLLVIVDTDQVVKSSDSSFKVFMGTLKRTVCEWTEGRNYDGFPTPPTPFHVVFQCSVEKSNEVKLRLKRYGLDNIKVLDSLYR